jgi:hypothetical protein
VGGSGGIGGQGGAGKGGGGNGGIAGAAGFAGGCFHTSCKGPGGSGATGGATGAMAGAAGDGGAAGSGGSSCGVGNGPSACAQCCYAENPGASVSLVDYDCACAPGAACALECNPSSAICGGATVDADACVSCFKGTVAPGGACASDVTFQQMCLGTPGCANLAACLATCG